MTAAGRVEDLAAVLIDGLGAGAPPESFALLRQLIPLLAEGKPVSPDRVARASGWPRERLLGVLGRMPSVEWDERGDVVGAGLTLRVTPHRFQLADRVLYTWCALDALMFPGLIGQAVRVESPCAATGAPVNVTVTPEAVQDVQPEDAVVSFVVPEASPDIRRVFCRHVNFFASAPAAADWLAKHPWATTLPVAEAYQVGRRLMESVFRQGGRLERARWASR